MCSGKNNSGAATNGPRLRVIFPTSAREFVFLFLVAVHILPATQTPCQALILYQRARSSAEPSGLVFGACFLGLTPTT